MTEVSASTTPDDGTQRAAMLRQLQLANRALGYIQEALKKGGYLIDCVSHDLVISQSALDAVDGERCCLRIDVLLEDQSSYTADARQILIYRVRSQPEDMPKCYPQY